MKFELVCVRIYATSDQYGEVPRWEPAGSPVTFEGFPGAGERVCVHLGPVPDRYIEANIVRRVMGGLVLESLFGGAPVVPLGERVEAERAKTDGDLKFESDNWYATISLSRTVDVVGDGPTQQYAVHGDLFGLAEELAAYSGPHLDAIASLASVSLDSRIFERIVLDDRVLTFAEGRIGAGVPVFGGSARVGVKKAGGSATQDLESRIQTLGRIAPTTVAQNGMTTVSRLYARALVEVDPTKRFSWGFLTLEVLANKLHSRFKTDILGLLESKNTGDLLGPTLPLEELLWEPARAPLRAKFASLAIVLYPESASEDLDAFATLKKARDSLAHGDVGSGDQLPVAQCLELAGKYVSGAVKYLALGVPARTRWEDVGNG